MIRKSLNSFLLSLSFCAGIASAAPNIPNNADHGQDYQLDLRVFKEFTKVDLLGEFEVIDTAYHDNYEHFQLGGRYLLSDAFKLGLHVRRATGIRHDEDWIKPGPVWKWRSVKSRAEVIVLPEVDYKRWLGSRPISIDLRGRYVYNTFNDHNSLQARVGLTYYFEKMSLLAQYEANFPLNYSENTIDEFWFYLTSIIPLSTHFSIGHSIGFGELRWSAPEAFPNEYETRYRSTRFRLNLNYYF